MRLEAFANILPGARSSHYALLKPPWSREQDPIAYLARGLETLAAGSIDDLVVARVSDASSLEVVHTWPAARDARFQTGVVDLSSFIDKLGADSGHIVIVDRFEALAVDAQIEWMGRFRAARESSSGPLRVVFAGRWCPRWMLGRWSRDGVTSPGLDTANLVVPDRWSAEGISDLLDMPLRSATERVRRAMVATVLLQTGGDAALVAELMHSVPDVSSPRDLERQVFDLSSRDAIEDIVRARVECLSGSAKRLLGACVSRGFVHGRLDRDDGMEQLWVEGLVRRRQEGSDTWQLASPLIGAIIRRCAHWLDLSRSLLLKDTDLAPTALPVLSAAAELILEIEGSLRNCILQGYLDVEPGEQSHGLLRAPPKVGGSTIYNEACIRSELDEKGHAGRFIRHPLSVQLEVADLELLLRSAPLAERSQEIFGDPVALSTDLKAFSELRNAVAHNKCCSIGAVEELEKLAARLLDRIGKAATRSTRSPPGAHVRVRPGTCNIFSTPNGVVVEVEIECIVDVDVHDVVVEVEFSQRGARPIRGISRSMSIARRAIVRARVECKAERDALEGEPIFRIVRATTKSG